MMEKTQHQAVFLLISFIQNRDNHNCFHHPNTNLAGQWWEFTGTKNAKCQNIPDRHSANGSHHYAILKSVTLVSLQCSCKNGARGFAHKTYI